MVSVSVPSELRPRHRAPRDRDHAQLCADRRAAATDSYASKALSVGNVNPHGALSQVAVSAADRGAHHLDRGAGAAVRRRQQGFRRRRSAPAVAKICRTNPCGLAVERHRVRAVGQPVGDERTFHSRRHGHRRTWRLRVAVDDRLEHERAVVVEIDQRKVPPVIPATKPVAPTRRREAPAGDRDRSRCRRARTSVRRRR